VARCLALPGSNVVFVDTIVLCDSGNEVVSVDVDRSSPTVTIVVVPNTGLDPL
jgi:hypothetical protein